MHDDEGPVKPNVDVAILAILRANPLGLVARFICREIGRSFETVNPVLNTLSDYGEIHQRFGLWHFGPGERITYRGDENLAAMQKHSLETTS